MLTYLVWYIFITVIGIIAFPITYRLFPALADRGYTFSRTLGLLVWGYVFWLFASLGIIRNDLGGLILGLIVLIGLSYWALRSNPLAELYRWWIENRRVVFSVEALFLVAFAGWTLVRASNPEILGTEKPMELAFINAILHSPEFPPHDPWLSGYAISYYYFGYLMTAMIAKMTATPGSVAFNMALSQTFALSAVAAYGVLFSLLGAVKAKKTPGNQSGNSQNLILSLLGPTFILIASNLEGFLEVLHARGIFWQQGENGQMTSTFWSWLDLKELSLPPAQPLSWIPSRYLWWWRASRVVQDYDLSGTWREVIDEFPFFSYLLGDLHPHVLAMPFALLAVGLCLNLFFGGASGRVRWLGLHLGINSRTFWVSALIIGGLAFLNTWDFPMYVFLFSLVYVVWKVISERRKTEIESDDSDQEFVGRSDLIPVYSLFGMAKDFFIMALALTLSGVLLYLPFYFGFSSQAGGILPNLIYSTRGAHLWIMFGALLLPIFAYLIFFRSRNRDQFFTGRGFLFALGMVFGLWLLSLLFGIGIASIPLLGNIFVSSIGGEPGTVLLAQSIERRISGMGWVTLVLLLGLTFGYLLALIRPKSTSIENPNFSFSPQGPNELELTKSKSSNANDFVFLLILMGGLLVLFTEFFYLRDQFGSRMNTIFKFYYQTWIFWGLAAAFGTAFLLKELRRFWAVAFRIGLAFLLTAALLYPLLSLWNKTNGFNPSSGFTLDGTANLETNMPEDLAGIRWLEGAADGVVVEAVGPQYSEYARVATLSGKPNVLGWAGHESQWRGGRKEIGTRDEDIETIYRGNSWEDTKQLLNMYNVSYVFIGTLERRTYRVNESKFEQNLGEPVFKLGQVSIYQIPR
jgi:YYY domain-containing protein